MQRKFEEGRKEEDKTALHSELAKISIWQLMYSFTLATIILHCGPLQLYWSAVTVIENCTANCESIMCSAVTVTVNSESKMH